MTALLTSDSHINIGDERQVRFALSTVRPRPFLDLGALGTTRAPGRLRQPEQSTEREVKTILRPGARSRTDGPGKRFFFLRLFPFSPPSDASGFGVGVPTPGSKGRVHRER